MSDPSDPGAHGGVFEPEEAGQDFATERVEVDEAAFVTAPLPKNLVEDLELPEVESIKTKLSEEDISLIARPRDESMKTRLDEEDLSRFRSVVGAELEKTIDEASERKRTGLSALVAPFIRRLSPSPSVVTPVPVPAPVALPQIEIPAEEGTIVEDEDEDDDLTVRALRAKTEPDSDRRTAPGVQLSELARAVQDAQLSITQDESDRVWSEPTPSGIVMDDEPTVGQRRQAVTILEQAPVERVTRRQRARERSQRALLRALRAERAKNAQRFGKYYLLGQVGRGGMAEVRLAYEDIGDDIRPCVIKRISSSHRGREDYREMFEEEGRIGRLLRHPNVVRMYDAGEIEGSPFICFELIDGITATHLEKLIGQEGMPPWLVVTIAREVAKALGYAHSLSAPDGTPLDLVHRDISPQNILLSRVGEVKLADFGIALFEGREHETRVGLIKGKMRYLAPEQLRMERVDGRTDIFSLGIVMCELLTGRALFPASVFASNDASKDIATRLEKVQPRVPENLTRLLLRMTAGRRDARPDFAEAVARELDVVLETLDERVDLVDYLDGVFNDLPGLEEKAFATANTRVRPETRPPLELREVESDEVVVPSDLEHGPDEDGDEQPHYPTSVGLLFPDLFGSLVGAEPTSDARAVELDSMYIIGEADDSETRRVASAEHLREYWFDESSEGSLDGRPQAAIATDVGLVPVPGSVHVGAQPPAKRPILERVVITVAILALVVAGLVVGLDYFGLI